VLNKVLIANRGEIAVRVIRTCKELGITSVAVYSELDLDSLHVRLADEAYALGGRTATESYLDTRKILDVAQRCGADGLHPGYGFFSENADFARAVTALGIVWIGPPPDAVEVMGDKISSRLAAARAEVASVPGTTEVINSVDDVLAFGEQYGWPVAVKAAYGGGGRGMRVISAAAEAAEALEAAQREALASFGRSESYLERYLTWPRHVEVQIFGDTLGNTVYLGTRDCSDIPEETLDAMGQAAVRVAKACGYTNAGTVEFIHQDGEFYFLEMNTRLQVEHPVTEQIVGMDLVALQLRVASGEPLGFTQGDVKLTGHAIEVRINAEDPADGKFLPSPGRITKFRRPDGYGVRTDAGYEEGDEVSQYYDNLVAKVITWGGTREEARLRMLRALGETVIEGIATTIPADIAILSHPDFIDVSHSTTWVGSHLDLSSLPAPTTTIVPVDESAEAGPKVARDVDVEVNGKHFRVKLWVPESSSLAGGPTASRPRPRPRKATAPSAGPAGSSENVTVPMQGTVIKMLVEVGDQVEAGQAICILEAMKMENHINTEVAGEVKELKVAAGDTVGAGDVVAIIG
jgi:acetyl-CoA/propionyl-CoA carboxylase biotin carboxyl carrier protein